MDINIKGDPGTGNSFTEINVMEGGIYQPYGTTNITNIYGNGKKSEAASPNEREKEIIRNEVLEYVGQLNSFVNKEWAARYEQLWVRILALKEVEAEIYNPGRQRGHTFNRNFVGNIICVILKQVYTTDNCTVLNKALEGRDSQIRKMLNKDPSDEVKGALLKLLKEME